MKDAVYKISLDIHEHGSQTAIKAKNTDTGRKLCISLRSGGTPYIIEDDCYAVFKATKPDGTILYNACTIENNEIIYEFTPQTCAAIGRCRCEIALYGLDDKLITSPRFMLLVDGTIYPDDVVESTDEFSALTDLVGDTLKFINEATEAAKSANESAVSANNATINANQAAESASQAATAATQATQNANTAAGNANTATKNANEATNRANEATQAANNATSSVSQATERANEATNNATLAADNANKAATKAAHTAKSLMVVGEEKGEVIALDDAIDQFLVGCRIFGKTTQDGTPTPDAPVELVNVGDSGSISVKIASVNLAEPMRVTAFTDTGVTFSPTVDGNMILNGTVSGELWKSIYRVATVKGQTYTVSGAIGVRLVVWCTETEQQVAWKEPNQPYISFTANSSKYVLCVSHHDNETFNNLRVDCTAYPGTAPLPWTPYNGQIATVSIPNGLPGIPVASGGNYTDANGQQWICDEIDLARGVYVQRVLKKAFTGSNGEGWEQGLNTADGVERYLSSRKSVNVTRRPICSHFECVGSSAYILNKEALCYGSEGYYYDFAVATERCPDLASWKAYLAEQYANGTPVTVCHLLDTTIETPLSEEELAAYAALHTYRNNATISNDASAHMELEYVMDAKKYIDSLVTGTIIPARVE